MMTIMTIITMGGDNLPNETNNPSAPSRSYYFIWMGNCGVKEDGPTMDRLNAGKDERNSSSVRRSLNEKELDCTIISPRVIISKQKRRDRESYPYTGDSVVRTYGYIYGYTIWI